MKAEALAFTLAFGFVILMAIGWILESLISSFIYSRKIKLFDKVTYHNKERPDLDCLIFTVMYVDYSKGTFNIYNINHDIGLDNIPKKHLKKRTSKHKAKFN